MPPKSTMRLHAGRAFTWSIATLIYFSALSYVALPKATALTFLTPIFATIFAIIVFKETLSFFYMAALKVAFIGTLIVLQPGFSSFEKEGLMVLAASMFWGMSDIFAKKISVLENDFVSTFFHAGFSCLMILPFFIYYSKPLEFWQWGIILIQSALYIVNMYSLTMSYRYGDFKVVQNFYFTIMLFTAPLSYLVFDEWITLPTLIGSSIILVVVGTIAYIEGRKFKNKTRTIELGLDK